MIKLAILTALISGLITAGNWYVSANSQDLRDVGDINNDKKADIASFDDCVAAGYPVMRSWPAQCATSDGRVFADTIDTLPTTSEPVTEDPDLTLLPHADGTTSAIKAAKDKAAKDFNVAVKNVDVTSVSPQEWPDGCLGLPEADQMCTMAIVPGYEVVLLIDGKIAIYRTNQDGSLVKLSLE